MILAELSLDPLIVELEPANDEVFDASIQANETVNLKPQSDDLWSMRVNTRHYIVQARDPVHQYELKSLYDGAGHVEAWIKQTVRNKQNVTALLVAVHKFQTLRQLSESVSIRVVEDILDGIIKQNKRRIDNYEQALNHITQECIIDGQNGIQRLIIRFIEGQTDSIGNAFRIYGKSETFDVSRSDTGYYIKGIAHNSKQQIRQNSLMILEGDICFLDASVATQQKQHFKTELDLIVAQSDGSYLNVWNEYNRLEREKMIEKVHSWGWIRFTESDKLPDGRLRLHCPDSEKANDFVQRIKRANELDLVFAEDLPPYISGEFTDRENTTKVNEFPVEIVKDEPTIEVRLRQEEGGYPKKSGYLFVSIHGDSVRLERRQHAWDLIRKLDTPIPGLGLLLERSSAYTPRAYKSHKIKTSELRRYFAVQPNSNQLQALELALKTPDILLIQGPQEPVKRK